MELTDILKSGDVDNMVIAENIQFLVTTTNEEDMFMRIGANGLISLYRAPDQDTHWIDTDNTQRVLDTVDTEILSITTDEELTAENGSYTISCRLDNTSNQTRSVTIHAEINGVPGEDQVYELAKNEVERSVLVSGVITQPYASGAVINVWFDSSGAGVELRGDILETKLKVTAAKSAPVTMSIEEVSAFDWNQLPSRDTGIAGQLYIGRHDTVRVSQG